MTKKKTVKKTTVTTVTEETVLNEKTHIICILDRSGSMTDIMNDSIGGFNEFLKQQKELPDEATLTVALFDDKYELLYDFVDIKEAKEITKKEWYPRGTTALYDAICKTIHTDRAKIDNLGVEAPSKVLVCVVTDGYENSSRENNVNDTKKLIKECEKNDWNFIYLAANQDAFEVGGGFGISYGNTYSYTASGAGVQAMNSTLTSAATKYRGMSSDSVSFSADSKSLIDDDKVSGNLQVSGNISVSTDIPDFDGVTITTGDGEVKLGDGVIISTGTAETGDVDLDDKE